MPDRNPEDLDDDDLYNIPVEELGLSIKSINAIKRLGVTTVGDCLDHHIRVKNGQTVTIHVYHDFTEAMHGEVEEQLKAHGYWIFYEKA